PASSTRSRPRPRYERRRRGPDRTESSGRRPPRRRDPLSRGGRRIPPRTRWVPTAVDTAPDGLHRRSGQTEGLRGLRVDRKSTRLNSSHVSISYAVFCLKKKTNTTSS